jgi:transposase-like protein
MTMKSLSCPSKHCRPAKATSSKIIRHGFYKTRWGKRRRYRCQTCGKTFGSANRTPYYRLQHRRATFDEVAALSVEGLNKSLESRESPGIRFIAGWKRQPNGAADLIIEK